MQSLLEHAPAEQPFDTAISANPCDCFDKLRATWCTEAMGHPQLAPLVSFAKQCSRMHWPNGETAGTLLYDVAKLARYLHELEARLAESEGDILRSEGDDE